MFTVFVFRNNFTRMFSSKFNGTYTALKHAIILEGKLNPAVDAVGIVDEYGKCHFALFKEGAE